MRQFCKNNVEMFTFEHGSESFGTAQSKALKSFEMKTIERVKDHEAVRNQQLAIPHKMKLTKAKTQIDSDFNEQGLVS